ncbi:MAG TPA: protease modulator HflC [Candidatus Wujingus californicus]|uniref:protease modulator HflC n=1 Tax=Candidatus Wujingus californicus TaxID=3367618 RepID=UPI001D40D599|nr:protease modulator HflC [Planctomycetota bacterium]MDO8131619.1 protease modulator HflC [Candidatus Brocadiales bacterium]
MKKSLIVIIIISVAAVLICLKGSLYVVDVRSQAVITQFGKPTRTIIEPGLYSKVPFIQEIRYFDKRLLEWSGEPSDILTRDKENIGVGTWARWKITDPLKFYTSLGTEARGQGVLDEVIESAVKNVVSAYTLKEVLRNTNRKLEYTTKELEVAEDTKKVLITMGRDRIIEEIQKMAVRALEGRYGIELVDVRIKYINYVEAVIPKIYDRMRSERIRIANKYESEGRREEAEILGSMKKELERIESEGYRTAEETKGQANAEAIRIYAEAYEKAPEFYSFIKTLETYENTFNKQTHLILSTDGEYFRYLKSFQMNGKSALDK